MTRQLRHVHGGVLRAASKRIGSEIWRSCASGNMPEECLRARRTSLTAGVVNLADHRRADGRRSMVATQAISLPCAPRWAILAAFLATVNGRLS
ncbi:hypothetical protein D9M72_368240 [compost metagenome]